MRSRNIIFLCVMGVLLAGCGTRTIKPSDQHILKPASQPDAASSAPQPIPEPIQGSVILPPPKPAGKVATYSVVVTNVPAQEILFALARDAKINLDIHSGIQGTVTVNAINQTLPQILTRIAKQVDMRYELDNGYLTVMPDSPYLHSYKIDYVNMARDSDGSVTNSTQIGSATSGSTAGSSSGGGNSSSIGIKSTSRNHFWDTLVQNIKDILHETDKILPAGSSETSVQQIREASSSGTGVQSTGNRSARSGIENSPNPVNVEEGGMTFTRRSTFREAAAVIANPENGLITVRATGKQHEKIQEFIDQVMSSARRQVLIEATIAEVRLSDRFQQGIDWSKILAAPDTKGFNLSQTGTGITPATAGAGTLIVNYLNPTSKFGNVAASISLLESFGNVKVLSSPKLSVMNNQTAMLRVVDNKVYFTVDATTTCPGGGASCTESTSYKTTVSTVPIGFTMSVTPQINDSDTVLLNIRPSITRLLTDAKDPTPGIIDNFVPQTSTREMESMLKIENNQTAVLGGLMEDRMDKTSNEIPILASIPLLGYLFKNRDDTTVKTELVIFLRPVVIKDADINGDYIAYRNKLPDQDFFKESAKGKR